MSKLMTQPASGESHRMQTNYFFESPALDLRFSPRCWSRNTTQARAITQHGLPAHTVDMGATQIRGNSLSPATRHTRTHACKADTPKGLIGETLCFEASKASNTNMTKLCLLPFLTDFVTKKSYIFFRYESVIPPCGAGFYGSIHTTTSSQCSVRHTLLPSEPRPLDSEAKTSQGSKKTPDNANQALELKADIRQHSDALSMKQA